MEAAKPTPVEARLYNREPTTPTYTPLK